MNKPVVVRFAPSPTGGLHVGGARTALYNYLFVKKHGGRMILRIEDTDRTRYVEGAEEYIVEALDWLGITFTEGVHVGGDYGPYRQSDRKALYHEYAKKLVERGKAYYAFDTPEELEAMRERLKASGSKLIQYNYITRTMMTNSLTLSEEEVERRLAAGEPYVIRMKIPKKEEIRFHDLVRGWVVFQSNQLDDKILMKSDGMPTYHMANIVDDHLMEITHVIRGEEWLSSTPLHVLLYRAFGWEDTMPQFVHLPLLLKPDGKGKLSKRAADKLGIPVFPLEWTDPRTEVTAIGYREEGFLPEALVNFLALLGWNPGNDEELMSMERMIEAFSLERIIKSGARFDINKAKWFNQVYLRKMSDEEILSLVKVIAEKKGQVLPADSMMLKVISLMKERVQFAHEVLEQAGYMFEAPTEYNAKMTRKRWTHKAVGLMKELKERFRASDSWAAETLHGIFQAFIKEKEVGTGAVLAPLRLALTGLPKGPGVFDIAEILGKDEALGRIETAIEVLVPQK